MTRQPRIIDGKNPSKLVDKGPFGTVRSTKRGVEVGQGDEGREGIKINSDVWSEFILVANYLYRNNEDAEVADVFEFFRMKDLGGDEYSASTLKRAIREVETECGPF